MKRIASIVTATALALAVAGPALGHTHTVDPRGNGETRTEPISNPWAQAHCHAASPARLAEVDAASSFTPAGALPCPTTPGSGWPPGLQD